MEKVTEARLHLEKVTEVTLHLAKCSLSLEYLKVTEAMAKCNLSLNYSQKIFWSDWTYGLKEGNRKNKCQNIHRLSFCYKV